jgi:hypothetical protein
MRVLAMGFPKEHLTAVALPEATRHRLLGSCIDGNIINWLVDNTKSKTFKETHNLKSGRIWCIGTQNVENGYKRAFFARLGEGLKKN